MILGNTNFVDFATGESFKMSGVTHLLAISGMNVAIIAVGFIFILQFFVNRKLAYIITSVIVILYVSVAGFGASILRAGIMFIIFSYFKAFSTEKEFLEVVVLSAFVVLVYNPFYIQNAGFWLSYMAVAGIYFFTEPLRRPFSFLGKRLPEILSVTLAANIATMPVLLFCFKGVSIISPLANLIIIPVFDILTYALFIDFIFVMIGLPLVSFPIEWLISVLWKFSQKTAEVLSLLPFSYQTFQEFPFLALIIFYAVIAVLFFAIPAFRYRMRLKKFKDYQKKRALSA